MKILKSINNNVINALDDKGREVFVSGKGIGFGRKPGENFEPEENHKIFISVDKTFSSQFKTLIETMDYKTIQLAEEIIEQAKHSLGKKLNQNIYITLTDHLNYALERQQKGVVVHNALLWEIERFYKPEYQAGLQALELIEKKTGIQLPKDEAGFFALHLANAEMDANLTLTSVMPEMIQDILNIVQYTMGVSMNENSLSYERFITHLKFLLQRVINKQVYTDIDEDMFAVIRKNNLKEYKCALKIKDYLKSKIHFEISDEELLYLTMHVCRASRD